MQLDYNSTGANSTGEDILGAEYGYKMRWSGDGGGDPRQTSFEPFKAKVGGYSNLESSDAATREERPLMEDVEDAFRDKLGNGDYSQVT